MSLIAGRGEVDVNEGYTELVLVELMRLSRA